MKLYEVFTILTTLGLAAAHIALWDEAMYGFDAEDHNQSDLSNPLRDLPLTSWWFHGRLNNPPAPGAFMSLPAGGVYHGEVSCNKAFTRYGYPGSRQQDEIYACPKPDPKSKTSTGAMHTIDAWETPVQELKDVTGCAIAIAYESDPKKIKPEDFVVISTNYTCPWFKEVDFEIPSDLPACPEGGCHCMWGWVPSGNGGIKEMYTLNYRCKVEGAKGTWALPKPQKPTKCDYPTDKTNCTIGAKQPLYRLQLDHNNVEYEPTWAPFYNGSYGYMNGAQTDLFAGTDSNADDKDLDGTYRLQGLGLANPHVQSSGSTTTSHSASASGSTKAAKPTAAKQHTDAAESDEGKQTKGKSGKTCKRRSRRSSNQAGHGHGHAHAQTRRAGHVPTERSLTRRMDLVSSQARWKGGARRRDSTAV